MFGCLTGFSERAIVACERDMPMSELGLHHLKEIEPLWDRLTEVITADAVAIWLNTPNVAFDGLKPLEVVERGEIDRLWNMIFYLESGLAG